MKAEIDQSGKLEHLGIHTVIAIANKKFAMAIYISSPEKIKVIKRLRKSIVNKKDIVQIVFTSIIFLLSKNIKDLSMLTVDEEYTGKEKLIQETFDKLYLRFKILKKPYLNFGRIGKHSPAHDAAIGVFRKHFSIKFVKIKAKDIFRLWNI